jgi:hypothetical protein
MNVRFSPSNRWVLSVGGHDRSAMQWRVLAEAQDEVLQDKPQVCFAQNERLVSQVMSS